MSVDPANDQNFPFPNFESDETAYANSRLFWKAAFDDARIDKRSAWQDWMPDPFKDGHPIFSAVNHGLRRGVLLQQVPRTDDPVWFKCWVSEIAGSGPTDRIPYLFVETFISERGRRIFRDLVGRWCGDGLDEVSMERTIARIRREIVESEQPFADLHHSS